MLNYFREVTLKLRPTLVTTVIFIITLTGLGVGISAYKHSARSINLLWQNLSKQIADTTTDKTLTYLKSAEPVLEFTDNLTYSDTLAIDDPMSVMSYCAAAVKAFPNFLMFYYAKADGTWISASNEEGNGVITGYWSYIDAAAPDRQMAAKMGKYTLQPTGWQLIEQKWGDYNPTLRPFWKQGKAHPEGAWSEPYTFTIPVGAKGVTYSKPILKEGAVEGMWLIDYLINIISDYLATIHPGKSEEVLIVSDEGALIASSKKREGSHIDQIKQEDQALANVWAYVKTHYPIESPDFKGEAFELGDSLVYFQSFPSHASVAWNVLTIVPRADFFGPIIIQAWNAAFLSIALCVLFALLAAVFFGRISRRLKQIAEEMQKIGSFEITAETFGDKHSFIHEVNIMNIALDRMKAGLGSFTKYLPVSLVSGLIRSGQPALLGGKKTVMTLLFADLANFTALSEKIAPDELIKFLDIYLSEMTQIIQSHRGVVDKFFGDAIMAFWGAPDPLEEHAVLACRAAVEMQTKANILLDTFKQKYGVNLGVRMGVNTGETVVGNIGSSERMDYTAIGDSVNLASRLEGLNKVYGTCILMGEETAKLTCKTLLLRPIDHVAVKGKKKAALVYQLVCEKNTSTHNQLRGVEAYTQGLDLFTKRDFIGAVEKFAISQACFGGEDLPSKILIERAKNYINNPPPSEWDGSVSMDFK